MFTSIAAVRDANKRAGFYFFERGALSFFNSRVASTLYGGRYFITSEQFEESYPRKYTIREAFDDGRVETVGEFQAYADIDDAREAARALVAALKVAN